MPKTTVDLPSEVLAQLEKLQKQKGFEYLKDAYLYALKHGLDIMENNIEKGIEQSIQIREPIAEEPSETQIPPCPYASLVVRQNKNGLEYLAYCDNPKKTNLPRDRLLPCIACQKCYQREKAQQTQLIAIFKELHKYWEIFHCFAYDDFQHNQGEVHTPEQFFILPCFKDFDLDEPECGKNYCPLHLHKEWRKLIADNIAQIF